MVVELEVGHFFANASSIHAMSDIHKHSSIHILIQFEVVGLYTDRHQIMSIDVGAKFVWGRLWMCFNRESDGREKWRFDLDDNNIYTAACLYVTATEI